jgi:flagellin
MKRKTNCKRLVFLDLNKKNVKEYFEIDDIKSVRQKSLMQQGCCKNKKHGGKIMRINNNMMAQNAHRYLSSASGRMSKSLEKISSGLRINSAADDAAGLAISEKMRAQISGLEQAATNAQNGISLIQTAEGALNETHSILQRMRQLAVNSSNDTNTETDRAEIQKEVDELATELSRISDTTEFNTENLLNGDFDAKFHIGANAGQKMELQISDMSASELGVSGNGGASFEVTGTTADNGTGTLVNTEATFTAMSLEDYAATEGVEITWADSATTEDATGYVLVGSDGNAKATSADGLTYTEIIGTPATNGDTVTFLNEVTSGSVQLSGAVGAGEATGTATIADDSVTLDGGTYTITDISTNGVYGGAGWSVGLADSSGEIVALGSTDLIGGKAASADAVANWVNVDDTSDALISLTAAETSAQIGDEITVSGEGIDVSTQTAASSAITVLDTAISTVSAERSKLGAYQNRLEHTINNLSTTTENLQASESRIRDVDVAKEMMEFTKLNILSQASQSMLAQANQAPQGVLQLLG